MADPISILGLVAGIITFVDFGYKVISGSKSARDSIQGRTPDVARLNKIVQEIRLMNAALVSQISGQRKPSPLEKHVIEMVQESEKLNLQLHKEIEKLTMRSETRFKHLESGRVALQSIRSHKSLQSLGKELLVLDHRVRSGIQMVLELNHHDSVMSRLKDLQDSQKALGIDHETKFNQIKDSIIHLTGQEHQKHVVQIAEQGAQLLSLKAKVDALLKEHSDSSKAIRVVRSLYFQEVRRRFDQIPYSDRRSNDWIYDPSLTTFSLWLESNATADGLFYIWGKPGSGKSTLMKYISEDERTRDKLKTWSRTEKLYIGSYFFWNQGSEMQKSRTGLMQSLLYQILRASPELIPPEVGGRLDHEVWDMNEMIATFEYIANQTRYSSKFCFFIDGLDEYNGDQNDIAPMLKVLISSPHIKLCASSRPGRLYEQSLRREDRAFDIARFTKEDMRHYVQNRLTVNTKFQRLSLQGTGCQNIISNISGHARGVWLWVFLVTRDILYEVDRDEGILTLQKIVNEFPSDLERYFERIIDRIKDRHKEEMAQTFLVTVHELQPLPLFAFALLERERTRPDYALETPIEPVSLDEIEPKHPVWQARVRNRCGDLLVIDPGPHPVYLSHSVDFMHRTVRDFLRDCYHDNLRNYLTHEFSPLVSLCKIHLCLLKALPVDNFRDRRSVNRIIGLTDELLYYAHEAEKNCTHQEQRTLDGLLNELDKVNSHHARSIRNHWTHARDSPAKLGFDHYREGGQCNFLALAVQARLVKYVSTRLQADKQIMQKGGRPLLDYALRPRRVTPISMDYHTTRDDPSVDIKMVELLLAHGANPNQSVHLYDGESVWALFLLSIHEANRQEGSGTSLPESLKTAWYASCEAMIRVGAQSDHITVVVKGRPGLNTTTILSGVFGPERAKILEDQIEAIAARKEMEGEKSDSENFCLMM
ncbi:hypothetical protein HBI56_137370 [Parastagonospora nodorum]|nr:hypothetical protein HBH72_138690 [Parastagonospora nodorum]KAH5301321.1 hypothetical protein HBI11_144520 [Parastagonospora nodorum]KAH6017020.1 hypothetical protein HBI82_111680 [Parastagonospora nodorum]KAH6194076.1 hypothetical protein HBI15_233070 [Parastagonospora nodorum]KAH6430796.1 hypothetical protein HBI08_043770 [Parastagonospora nodorum]